MQVRFEAHEIPTAIVGTFKLGSLALKCDKDRRPHVHDQLTGTVTVDGVKKFKTRLAQVYPTQLFVSIGLKRSPSNCEDKLSNRILWR